KEHRFALRVRADRLAGFRRRLLAELLLLIFAQLAQADEVVVALPFGPGAVVGDPVADREVLTQIGDVGPNGRPVKVVVVGRIRRYRLAGLRYGRSDQVSCLRRRRVTKQTITEVVDT